MDLQFKVLNPVDTPIQSDEQIHLELDIQSDIHSHSNAIHLLSIGRTQDASDIYTSILKNNYIFDKLPQIKDIHASNHHLLKYVVFKNYAHILHLNGELTESIKYYQMCLDIDPSDPSVWLVLGSLANKLDDTIILQTCLENAFNQTMNSKIFTCNVLEKICDQLIESKDFQQAYMYIQQGLKMNSKWKYGLELKEQIIQGQSDSLISQNFINSFLSKDDVKQLRKRVHSDKEEFVDHSNIRKLDIDIDIDSDTILKTTFKIEDRSFTSFANTIMAHFDSVSKGSTDSSLLSQVQFEYPVILQSNQMEIIDTSQISADSTKPQSIEPVIPKGEDKRYSKRVKITDMHVDANTLCHIDEYLSLGLSFDDAYFADFLDISEFLESVVSRIQGTKNVVQTLTVERRKKSAGGLPKDVVDSEKWTAYFHSFDGNFTVLQWMMKLVAFVLAHIHDGNVGLENKTSLVALLAKVLEMLESNDSGFLHQSQLTSSDIKMMAQVCLLFLQDEDIVRIIRLASTQDTLINPYYDFKPLEILKKYVLRIQGCHENNLDLQVAVSYIQARLHDICGGIQESLVFYQDIHGFLLESGEAYTIEFCCQEISLESITNSITDITSRIDLENVLCIFEQVFSDMDNQIHDACHLTKRLTLLKLLKESYVNVGKLEDAWICAVMYFNIYVLQGSQQDDLKWEDWCTKVSELMDEMEFYSVDHVIAFDMLESRQPSLKLIGATLQSLLHEFILTKMFLMRLSWEVCPIISDTIKPMRKSKSNILSKLVIGSISIFMDTVEVLSSRIVKDNDQSPISSAISSPSKSSTIGDSINKYAEVAHFIHAHIGQHKLCCFDDGRLLKRNMQYITDHCASRYSGEVYQIYNCLYGINIKLESDHTLIDHDTRHQIFDKANALSALVTVYDHLKARMNSHNPRSMTAESKECLATLQSAARKNITCNGKLMMNKSLVDSYLKKSSESVICTTLDPTYLLPANSVSSITSSGLIDVRAKIPYLFAKSIYLQLKSNSTTSRTFKTVDSLLEAIKNYTKHLYFDTMCANSWMELGYCYANLAYDYLGKSAIEIRTNEQMILRNLHKSFGCYLQSYLLHQKHGNSRITRADLSTELFAEFGNVCYTLMTKPVSQFTHVISKSSSIWAQRALNAKSADHITFFTETPNLSANIVTTQVTDKINIWPLHLRLFEKAIKLNDHDWQFYHMKAAALRKLKCEPAKIMEYLLKSIELLPADSGTKEQEKIWDAHITLFTCALKWNMKGILPYSESEMKDKLSLRWLNDTNTDHESLDLNQFIHSELQKIQVFDKKKWQHRVTYKIAWIKSDILKDNFAAIEDLCILVNLRPTAKNMTGYWKTEFERPGKFFSYLMKYTNALLRLITITGDLTLFQNLAKRIKRSDEVLLDPKSLWNDLFISFSQLIKNTAKEYASLTPPSVLCKRKVQCILMPLVKSDVDLRAQALYELTYANFNNLDTRADLVIKIHELVKQNDDTSLDTQSLQDLMIQLYIQMISEVVLPPRAQNDIDIDEELLQLGGFKNVAVVESKEIVQTSYILKKIVLFCKAPKVKQLTAIEIKAQSREYCATIVNNLLMDVLGPN